MKAASESKEWAGIIGYTEDEVVSTDFIHDPHSCVFGEYCHHTPHEPVKHELPFSVWFYTDTLARYLSYLATRCFSIRSLTCHLICMLPHAAFCCLQMPRLVLP